MDRAGTMRIEFTLTPKELADANNAIERHEYGIGDSKLKLAAIVAVVLAIFYYRIYTSSDPQNRWFVMIGLTILAIPIVYVLFRIQRSGRSPERLVLEISDDGIVATTAIDRSEASWAGLARYIERDDLFLLEQAGKSDWIIIPKRAIADQVQLDDFRGYLARIQPQSQAASMIMAASAVRPAVVAGGSSRSAIVTEFKYGYRDYLDLVLASWVIRGLLILVVGAMVAAGVRISLAGAEAPDDWVGLPELAALTVGLIVVVPISRAAIVWLCDPARNLRQSYTFSDKGMSVATSLGTTTMSWTTYSAFKETPWSFLLWAKKAGSLESTTCLIPKRALSSPSNVAWLRDTLAAKVPKSTWYLW